MINLRSMIKDLRKKIYVQLGIPVHHRRLTSCGGRLFLDNRTLAYYNIRDREIVEIRLRLKGGGLETGYQSRKRLAPWSASKKTKHLKQLTKTTLNVPRWSERLSLKRRKKENKEYLGHKIEACDNQENQFSTMRPQKELVDAPNYVAVAPPIFSTSLPMPTSASTGLSQELEDLMISDNHDL